jgi:AAA domain/Bifunctional DNA primase/polymerase, N-terminal
VTAVKVGPYAQAADVYWNAGWRGILPLPARCKLAPPEGWTGGASGDPSYADVTTWAEDGHGRGNIALRLPADVLGIDVDAYGEKKGADTLRDAEQRFGPLPPTWIATSRDDGISGIRLYKVPEGLWWPDAVGEHIDVIRRSHRYAVVWPSIHPEGRPYHWIDPGSVVANTVPKLDELPDLPGGWVDGLTRSRGLESAQPFTLPDRITLGQRDQVLFEYARSLRDQRTPVTEAVLAMGEAWKRCEQPSGDEYPLKQALRKIDSAWGWSPPAVTVLPDRAPRPTLADRAYSREQLAALPQPRPLIADTLDRRTVAILAGARGSLKTFVLVSWFCSVATGTRWLDRTAEQGRVLLVAAEGADGMHQRIDAWETEHRPVPDDQLTVISGPVNMLDRGQVAELAEMARGYTLIGLDTLARCAVGGDENSAKDMGLFVDACYQLRDATADGTVAVAHHTPKGNTTTLRGSSALEGGVDTIYVAEGGPGGMTLNRDKRKEGPTEDTIQTRLQLAGMSGFLCGQKQELTNAADTLMSVYLSAFSNTGATKAELRLAAGMPPATFHRSLNSLIELGLLRNTGTAGRPFYVGKDTSTP